jgi:hypothetical protein
MSEVMGDATQRVLIFDDFERAVMTPREVLGYINPLVEHDGCKVLILANEREIDKSDPDYSRRREKTVGRTMGMKADARSAFPSFLEKVGDVGARKYLESVGSDVLAVFKDSGLDNLRLLNHFVWDFERFWLTLSPSQQAHKQAMRELAMLLCAAALKLRSGRIEPASFKRADMNHFMRARRKDPDPDTVKADQLFKRYPTVNFDGNLLSPETVREIILDSAFPVQSVQDQLQGHPFFQQPQEIPSWRALWHSFNLEAAELDLVLATFQRDFDERRFHDEGEILHIVGLCLWMSDIGQPGWNSEDIVKRLEDFVDDTCASGDMEPKMKRRSALERLTGGSSNLAFFNRDDPRLARIAGRFDEVAEARRKSAYPEIGRRLLGQVTDDAEGFLREVCFTESGPAHFARSAVLASISPLEFATVVAASSRSNQEKVAMALSIRYENAHWEPELSEELPWLADMVKALGALAAQMPPIPRNNLRNLFAQYVCKHVPQPAADALSEDLTPVIVST